MGYRLKKEIGVIFFSCCRHTCLFKPCAFYDVGENRALINSLVVFVCFSFAVFGL